MAASAIGFIIGMIVELMVDNIHINDLYKKIDELSMENEQLKNEVDLMKMETEAQHTPVPMMHWEIKYNPPMAKDGKIQIPNTNKLFERW
jgi:sortase (surface protein transpeptidase)